MNYEGSIFRPPSEARSLIFQITIGCSHNECIFCGMYKGKKFRIRPLRDVIRDIDEMSEIYGAYSLRIFLGDGDVLAAGFEYMEAVLQHLKLKFPYADRVTAYVSARNILGVGSADLIKLRKAGLSMVYVGAESGDDDVLRFVRKGVTAEETAAIAPILKESGIALSLTLISGLGGEQLLSEHAINSAKLISKMKPEYLGFLTLVLDLQMPLRDMVRRGQFVPITPEQCSREMIMFLSNVDSEGTVFRANHVSNYVQLKGTLNRDIPEMVYNLERAIDRNSYTAEYLRRT